MTLLEAIILGLVQGLSEFLPVSSSGNLLLVHHLLGITAEDNLTFIIVLNLGSLVPLLYVFRKDVWGLMKRPFQKMTAILLVATAPIIVVTLIFGDFIESMFHSIYILPIGFIITGTVLVLSDKLKTGEKEIKDITWLDTILIGCAQAVAVFPGISRSGSTITAGLARGISRESAAKFSFLMSIPTAIGAILMRTTYLATGRILLEDLNLLNLTAGFITAAISGYLAINFMLAIVKRAKLKYFAFFYVFALAGIIIFDIFILNSMIFG